MDFPTASVFKSTNVTTAGTTIIVASSATSAIYVTGLIVNNGAAAGLAYFGYGTSATAPTTSAILINTTYLAVNTAVNFSCTDYNLPFVVKVPAGQNFLMTAATCSTLTLHCAYYLAG
jgi:hypothetical protein